MATTTAEEGERVQSWVPTTLADELREKAAEERRSVSQLIRLAVEQSLAEGRDGEAV